MPIVRGTSPHDNYTVTSNVIVNDTGISFKALGILMYLLSKPPGWKVTEASLAGDMREGLTAIGTGCDELIARGYMVRTRVNSGDGKFTWNTTVYGERQTIVDFPLMDNPLSVVSNEEVSNSPSDCASHDKPKPVKPGEEEVAPGNWEKKVVNGSKEVPPHVGFVLAYFNGLESLGRTVDRKNFARWVGIAKKVLEMGYLPSDVELMVSTMGRDKWWDGKPIPMEKVLERLMATPKKSTVTMRKEDDWQVTNVVDPFKL